MGVNFTALFDYSINKQELQYLPRMLNDKADLQYLMSEISSFDEIRKETWNWPEATVYTRSIEDELDEDGYVTILGPGGFELYIGKHLCELSSSIRWRTFLSNQLTREKLRTISFKLSKIFGDPLYAPDYFCLDSYLFDGDKMDKVNIYLLEKYGQPSGSLNEMLDDLIKSNEHRKYYLENFKDLLS